MSIVWSYLYLHNDLPVTAEVFPVQVAALGLPSDASIEVLTPQPDVVQVVGRADRLQQVAETVAHIRIETYDGIQSGEVRVQAVDETGLALQNVRVEPDSVYVSVVVSSKSDDTNEETQNADDLGREDRSNSSSADEQSDSD